MQHAGLDWISTQWPLIHDPAQFVVRYAPAVQKYLQVLVKNSHDAEEIAQEFLLAVLKHRFLHAAPERGRFRDYLKRSVRNAISTHYRRRVTPVVADEVLQQIVEATPLADAHWLGEWRRCLLSRAWRDLDHHERETPGSLCATVLQLSLDHPDDTSEELAQRMGERSGRPLQPPALRKQLSRARRLFAKALVDEVKRTLKEATVAALEEELTEVGLMPFVSAYWPALAE